MVQTYKMKFFAVLILSFLMFACAGGSEDRTINPQTIQTQGGVDVGNMSSTATIPGTSATLTIPSGHWRVTVVSEKSKDKLVITNETSSTIIASRAELDLAMPTQLSLEKYLEAKNPGVDYQQIEINGFKGVSAHFVDSFEEQRGEMYIISELHDFIHITSDLKKSDDGITQGEKIILSVRMKYRGEAILNSIPKSISLKAKSYSLLEECFDVLFAANCKTGVPIDYNFDDSTLGISHDLRYTLSDVVFGHGRIIELGSSDQIPFELVVVEGEYLISPKSKTPLADIYTTFDPQGLNKESERIKIKVGYIYLIRTVDWPFEDIITKVKIESIADGGLNIIYQKLVTVNRNTLDEQIKILNQNSLHHGIAMHEGEVTLFNQTFTKNRFYASFNFQFSNSGNYFLTKNQWDLRFDSNCGNPTFTVPSSEGSLGGIVPFENKSLEDIRKEDFPSIQLHKFKSPFAPGLDPKCDESIVIGKTFGIYHHKNGVNSGAIYGAFKVLEMDKDAKWVRFKFRRISVDKAERFQKWIETPKNEKFSDYMWKYKFFKPFLSSEDSFIFSDDSVAFHAGSNSASDYLSTTNRLFANETGLINFGKNVSLDQISVNDFQKLSGQFKFTTEISAGDVIGIMYESYYYKTISIIKIDEHRKGVSVNFSGKYLYHANSYYGDK